MARIADKQHVKIVNIDLFRLHNKKGIIVGHRNYDPLMTAYDVLLDETITYGLRQLVDGRPIGPPYDVSYRVVTVSGRDLVAC